MRVGFSRRALSQVRELHDYIAASDIHVARRIVLKIERAAILVGRHPSIGRSTNLSGVRVLSLRPYPFLMFYRVDAETDRLTILRIRHAARKQDWRTGH